MLKGGSITNGKNPYVTWVSGLMTEENRIGIGAITTAAFTVLHESKRIWPFNNLLAYIPSLREAVSLRIQHTQFVNQLLEKRRGAKDPEPDLYVTCIVSTDPRGPQSWLQADYVLSSTQHDTRTRPPR